MPDKKKFSLRPRPRAADASAIILMAPTAAATPLAAEIVLLGASRGSKVSFDEALLDATPRMPSVGNKNDAIGRCGGLPFDELRYESTKKAASSRSSAHRAARLLPPTIADDTAEENDKRVNDEGFFPAPPSELSRLAPPGGGGAAAGRGTGGSDNKRRRLLAARATVSPPPLPFPPVLAVGRATTRPSLPRCNSDILIPLLDEQEDEVDGRWPIGEQPRLAFRPRSYYPRGGASSMMTAPVSPC